MGLVNNVASKLPISTILAPSPEITPKICEELSNGKEWWERQRILSTLRFYEYDKERDEIDVTIINIVIAKKDAVDYGNYNKIYEITKLGDCVVFVGVIYESLNDSNPMYWQIKELID